MKKWSTTIPDINKAKKLQKQTNLSEFVCKLLVSRGIESFEQAKSFIDDFELSDPFLLEDMGVAVDTIHKALEEGKKITIFGDYDCDGVTATVILYSYLEAIGGEVDYYIPSRDEGYGMNIPALEKLVKQGSELIITVDNGISAAREADFLKEKGVDLIITDHHKPPEVLPTAIAIINPHRIDDNSPFKPLAGAGVALKLVAALEGGDCETALEQYADIATIGTVGDVVALEGENRVIVSRGLNTLVNTENLGLIQLMKSSGLSADRVNATSVAFTICPRINAAGRYDHASKAVDLFLCENGELAKAKAEHLTLLNNQRREAEINIIEDIEKQIRENPKILNERVLIISGENYHHGIIGIVSSRILEKYGKPTIIISFDSVEGRASARSIDGFSLYKLLTSCSDLLIRFGGHTKAAGFSIEKGNLELFCQRVREYCRENFPTMPVLSLQADFEVSADDLTEKNLDEISLLEPFGEGNTEPIFILRSCKILSLKSLKDGKYTSFEFIKDNRMFKALCFSIPYQDFWYHAGESVDILGVPQVNEYQGQTSINIRVKDIHPTGFEQDKYFNALAVYDKIKLNESVEGRLLKRIIPTRDDMKTIYNLIRKYGKDFARAELEGILQGVNNCMFRVAIDALEELGLVSVNRQNNSIHINQGMRADLHDSSILKQLKLNAK